MKAKGRSMREVSEGGDLRTFMDPDLIKALGHPVREHILAVLNERIASGKEIGDEIGADVSSFYHHIKELERLGCIEQVEMRQRRGWKEHLFKATRTVYLDDDAWRKIPVSVRADMTASFVQQIFDGVAAAVEAGTFGTKDDEHVSWSPQEFDEQGWSEVNALLDRTLASIVAIQKRSARRIAEGATEPTMATVAMLAFKGATAAAAHSSRPGSGRD